jgi:deoxycytidine triphosphate deaminase
MLIVGDNLKQLINQYNIVDKENAFDNFSITLQLSEKIVLMTPSPDTADIPTLYYGEEIPGEYLHQRIINNNGYTLPPKSCILACSHENILMPAGYFGLLQTKGSLARLFVSLTCTDGQVEPGYKGKVTFEVCNHSEFNINIKPRQQVGQLFIFKTSTKDVKLYNGKYQDAQGPTFQKPD